MIITSPNTPPPNNQKRWLKIIVKIVVLLLVLGGIGFLIWHLGSPKIHTQKTHRLYSSFDSSADHKKLISNLDKSKLSILFGKKENGLYQFIEHLANKLNQKGRKVIVESFSAKGFIIEFANGVHLQLAKQIGLYDNQTDWIFVSQNGTAIQQTKIKQVQQNYPNSKIIIITSSKQKIKGFKVFQYPQIDAKLLQKSIAKSFKVKESTAVILNDYFETDQELFQNLYKDSFSIQDSEILGDQFKAIEGLGSKQLAVLKDLCKQGSLQSKLKLNRESLASYGAIFVGGKFIWQSKKKLLNYEYQTNQNCVNKFASEKQLAEYQDEKEKEEQKRIKQEEQKRIKQEEAKAAQQKRIQQQLKKQEQLKKKQQQQQAAKKAKQEKSSKKKEVKQNSKKTAKQGKKK